MTAPRMTRRQREARAKLLAHLAVIRPMSLAESTKHGHAGKHRTATYFAWQSMLNRCLNPKVESYPRYGGRGIVVCERWRIFSLFLEDMGPVPPGLSLDRIDNDGHYEPRNCRWATAEQQAGNRSNARVIEIGGERLHLAELARRHGLRSDTLKNRLDAGWSVDDAVGTPVRGWRKNAQNG